MKFADFCDLFVRISCPHELGIDLRNDELPIMNDAACSIRTKAREDIFVKMPWKKLYIGKCKRAT